MLTCMGQLSAWPAHGPAPVSEPAPRRFKPCGLTLTGRFTTRSHSFTSKFSWPVLSILILESVRVREELWFPRIDTELSHPHTSFFSTFWSYFQQSCARPSTEEVIFVRLVPKCLMGFLCAVLKKICFLGLIFCFKIFFLVLNNFLLSLGFYRSCSFIVQANSN